MGEPTNSQQPTLGSFLKGKYLEKQDILQSFNVSERTLARRRKDGSLPYFFFGGKIFYPLEGVLRLFEPFQKDRGKKG